MKINRLPDGCKPQRHAAPPISVDSRMGTKALYRKSKPGLQVYVKRFLPVAARARPMAARVMATPKTA